jgi:energy-coupling factor transporter ATP-binding protein EcfA2
MEPGPPFDGRVFLPYSGRSLVLVGPNGTGKTRLLDSLTGANSASVFNGLPRRLTPYASVVRAQGQQDWSGLDAKALFEKAESSKSSADDIAWLEAHLPKGQPGYWSLSIGQDGLAWVTLFSEVQPVCEVLRFPVAERHLLGVREEWSTPGHLGRKDIETLTLDGFRSWATEVAIACGIHIRVYRNPLVAMVDRDGVSMLALADKFANVLASRTEERLERMAGFHVQFRCHPADDFRWDVAVEGRWMKWDDMSSAMKRWSSLAATESLRELSWFARDSSTTEVSCSVEQFLGGNLPQGIIPGQKPGAFASISTWIAMDEPELHLFASEAHTLGTTLSEHAQGGRSVLVTHSLELASRLVGTADFVTFDGIGRFEVSPPNKVTPMLTKLAREGMAILDSTAVLYVEGDWDIEFLRRLHGDHLDGANVILGKMNGVTGASLIASSVWHRIAGQKYGVMFDSARGESLLLQWESWCQHLARQGRPRTTAAIRGKIRAIGRAPFEEIEALRLFETVISGGGEERMRPVSHGLSDVFQLVHPSVLGLEEGSWSEAGYHGGGFKRFVKSQVGLDLGDGHECRRVIDLFDQAGMPVDEEAALALARALNDFFSWLGDRRNFPETDGGLSVAP